MLMMRRIGAALAPPAQEAKLATKAAASKVTSTFMAAGDRSARLQVTTLFETTRRPGPRLAATTLGRDRQGQSQRHCMLELLHTPARQLH
mmetsp:Transcript_53891/g.98541  ORF Transcript_53891/g.98541 Transcript_53891/m.98541 type:complete len:90 (-) Transcript_53891:51-320(-)